MLNVESLPKPFEARLPEIYQIEISSACNYNCVMCPRNMYSRKDKTSFIEPMLIDKLVNEGAFEGSYFVELQMSGEPTLHPELTEIITKVKNTGCKVGLSTNGSSLPDDRLLDLDYITISIDSVEEGQQIRKGRKDGFVEKVKEFIDRSQEVGGPVIDLQTIDLNPLEPAANFGPESPYKALERIFWYQVSRGLCNLRTIPNCFLTLFDASDRTPVSNSICLNPWLSVSIQSNGNVTACCFSFWDDIIFGNIWEQTLFEIWHGEGVKKLRREHEQGKYRPICARCYMRSPVLLHWEIFTSAFKTKR